MSKCERKLKFKFSFDKEDKFKIKDEIKNQCKKRALSILDDRGKGKAQCVRDNIAFVFKF